MNVVITDVITIDAITNDVTTTNVSNLESGQPKRCFLVTLHVLFFL